MASLLARAGCRSASAASAYAAARPLLMLRAGPQLPIRSFAKRPRLEKPGPVIPVDPEMAKGPIVPSFPIVIREICESIYEGITICTMPPEPAYQQFVSQRGLNVHPEDIAAREGIVTWSQRGCQVKLRVPMDPYDPEELFMGEEEGAPQPNEEFVKLSQLRMAEADENKQPPQSYQIERMPSHEFDIEITTKEGQLMLVNCFAAPWGEFLMNKLTVKESEIGWDDLDPQMQDGMLQFLYHLKVDHDLARWVQLHAMELRAKENAGQLKDVHNFFLSLKAV